jgi:PAP_fibrillin
LSRFGLLITMMSPRDNMSSLVAVCESRTNERGAPFHFRRGTVNERMFLSGLIVLLLLAASADNCPVACCFSVASTIGIIRRTSEPSRHRHRQQQQQRLFSTPDAPSDVEGDDDGDGEAAAPAASSGSQKIMEVLECAVSDENEALKRELLKLAAAFDRGFGASPVARKQVGRILDALQQQQHQQQQLANTGPASVAATMLEHSRTTSPTLEGTWRLIWTTALDVLLLQASPIVAVGAIHQVFDPATRTVANVIDFTPRAQGLFPPGLVPNTMVRATVSTRACRPAGALPNEYPNRVGLIFESVSVQPMEVFGMETTLLPPLAFDLPKLPGPESSEESPGYFDVTYLDKELLVIQQNEPGGLFALVRVDSIDSAS